MQRNKHLEPLSHDHFEGLTVAKRIRAGLARDAAPDVIAAYVARFWDRHLTRHFEQEERLLVPLAARCDASPLAERMAREHAHLRALAAALGDEDADRPALLETFAATLRDHIRFEERDLFPELERRADEADLAHVSAQLNAEPGDTDLDWSPRFWE